MEVARLLGWRTAHFRPALTKRGWRTPVQGDGRGFPDLVLVRDRILYRELKCGHNRVTLEQEDWLSDLDVAGADVGVWTDLDWHSGLIEEELRLEARVAA